MQRRLPFLALVVTLNCFLPGHPFATSAYAAPTMADSVIVLEGVAIDSAWSAQRNALAAGVTQGRSMDMERYTIQVFSGKRFEATQWYGRLQDSLGTTHVLLHFDEPNFKVSVGLYPIRLAAEHDLKHWRRRFPQAFVVRAPDVQPGK